MADAGTPRVDVSGLLEAFRECDTERGKVVRTYSISVSRHNTPRGEETESTRKRNLLPLKTALFV